MNYVVGISTTLTAQPRSGAGGRAVLRDRTPPVASGPDKPRSVRELVTAAGGKAARPVQWREGSRPGTGRSGRSGRKRMYSRFMALRVRPAGREVRQTTDGPELPVCRLPAEWSAHENERVQYQLPDLPSDVPLTTLVRLAELRRRSLPRSPPKMPGKVPATASCGVLTVSGR